MDWAQVLVIILGVVLAIFLVLAIILVSLLIKISQQIKQVTGSAQRTVANLESSVANFSKATSPIFLGKLITSYIKKFKK